MAGALNGINRLLWQWILPPLLVLTALVWAVHLRGKPLVGFGSSLRKIRGSLRQNQVSKKQTGIFTSALAATMGTGNLVGTVLALMTGGAGAVFWMWVSALLGMVLVYAENLLGERYRVLLRDGTVRGGALALLHDGLGKRRAAAFFAACCAVAGLGMGNLTQSGTVADTAAAYGIPRTVSGLLTAMLLFCLLSGQGRRAAKALTVLMPVMCVCYLSGCTVLLVRHFAALPAAFGRIFREAFGFRAAASGFSAYVFFRSLSVGIRRGIFSNEAGLGTSGLLHADAEVTEQLHPADWAAAEVFADTVICCTATALVVLTAPPSAQSTPAAVLLDAFRSGLGSFAGGFLAASMILFALATAIGWFPCGAAAFRYLFGNSAEPVYLALWVSAGFAGAFGSPEWVWAFSDCCNGLMALPNLYAMLRLLPSEPVPAVEDLILPSDCSSTFCGSSEDTPFFR